MGCLQKHRSQWGASIMTHPPSELDGPIRAASQGATELQHVGPHYPKFPVYPQGAAALGVCGVVWGLSARKPHFSSGVQRPPPPLSLTATSQPASLLLTLAYIPFVCMPLCPCLCVLSDACCPFAFPYSTFLLFCLTPPRETFVGICAHVLLLIEHLFEIT